MVPKIWIVSFNNPIINLIFNGKIIMEGIIINHHFEDTYAVVDVNNYDNCLYVGTFDSCTGYLQEYKRQEREHREKFNKLLINNLKLK
jgi:hypothetical protein